MLVGQMNSVAFQQPFRFCSTVPVLGIMISGQQKFASRISTFNQSYQAIMSTGSEGLMYLKMSSHLKEPYMI